MQLTLKDDLPFTRVKVAYRGAEIEISDVLVDTGSATTILADYGFEINGILGMDFLLQTGAIINLRDLSLDFDELPC